LFWQEIKPFLRYKFFGGDGARDIGRMKTKESLYFPVIAAEVYISLCNLLKIFIGQGFLFRPFIPSGEIFPAPFESAAAQAPLSTYVRQIPAFVNRKVTLHGLRSGCTISLAIAGARLDAIMDHVPLEVLIVGRSLY